MIYQWSPIIWKGIMHKWMNIYRSFTKKNQPTSSKYKILTISPKLPSRLQMIWNQYLEKIQLSLNININLKVSTMRSKHKSCLKIRKSLRLSKWAIFSSNIFAAKRKFNWMTLQYFHNWFKKEIRRRAPSYRKQKGYWRPEIERRS